MLYFCTKNCSHVILLNSEVKLLYLTGVVCEKREFVVRTVHAGTLKYYIAKLPHKLAERQNSYFI